MSDDSVPALVARLRRLAQKADFQTTAHAWLHDYYSLRHSLLTSLSLLAGVVLVAVVLLPPQLVQQWTGLSAAVYQVVIAGLAISNFSIVVVLLAWRMDIKASQHGLAVHHFTRAAHTFRDATLHADTITAASVERLESRYLDTGDLPRIPERDFLRLKQHHLQKIQISVELDKHPHESIRSIRRRLRSGQMQTADADART